MCSIKEKLDDMHIRTYINNIDIMSLFMLDDMLLNSSLPTDLSFRVND